MIEILSYKKINKSSLVGSINLKIVKWGLIINKVSYFMKDGRKWLSLPSEVYKENEERKFYPLVKFDNHQVMDKFQDSVFKALDEWISKNENQDQPKSDEELPF